MNRIVEISKDDDVVYESLILLSRVFSEQGRRDTHRFVSLYHALSLCPDRPEAYYWLCMALEIREPFQCYAYANVGIKNWNNYKNVTAFWNIS